MHAEPYLEVLPQHVVGGLAVPRASAVAEAKVLRDSGSGITTMSEELAQAQR